MTAFGDLAPASGERISTAAMQRLLGRLEVDGGSVRTALSRLTGRGVAARSGPATVGPRDVYSGPARVAEGAQVTIVPGPRRDDDKD